MPHTRLLLTDLLFPFAYRFALTLALTLIFLTLALSHEVVAQLPPATDLVQ